MKKVVMFSNLKNLQFCLLILAAFMILSCEKEVNINLGNADEDRLVVQGSIDINTPPLVLLSRSFNFFSNFDLNKLEQYYLHDAEIWVSNGTDSIKLKEYSLDTVDAQYYFYSVDTGNLQDLNFVGEAGKTYDLRIVYDGKTYTSRTIIPTPIRPDSIWFEEPDVKPENNPKAKALKIIYNDPDTLGNCFRIFTAKNGQILSPNYYSVMSDDITNGSRLKMEIAVSYSRTDTSFNADSTGYVYSGETVQLKWSAIDKKVYTFYSTLQFAMATAGNPFATPINAISNIEGGANGVWAGYGSWDTTMVVP